MDDNLTNSNSFKSKNSSSINLKKVKKLALNSQLLIVQILTNDVQVLILCLSYFIPTVSPLIPTPQLRAYYRTYLTFFKI